MKFNFELNFIWGVRHIVPETPAWMGHLNQEKSRNQSSQEELKNYSKKSYES